MVYKHLFIDSDILLDLLFERQPFFEYTKILIAESQVRNLKLSTSALIIANINYIHSKKTNASTTRESFKRLVKIVNVLSFESDIVTLALNSAFSDFEDAIQHFIASQYKCDVIITRNTKDYKQSSIPVITAEQFLRQLL